MSTDLAVPDGLVDPRTGEVLPATPENAATVWLVADHHEKRLQGIKQDCLYVLAEEAGRRGKKTLELDGLKAVLRGGPESKPEWDVEVLEQLRDLGLPDDRFDELVKTTVTVRVDARVAKQLAGANPEYAAVIGRARTEVDQKWSVSVT